MESEEGEDSEIRKTWEERGGEFKERKVFGREVSGRSQCMASDKEETRE